MTSLMVLGAGINQLPMINAATEYGLEVLAVDPDVSAPGLASATESYSFDLADLSMGLKVARSHNINGVVTLAADFPMPMLAIICKTMGLAGPSLNAVKKSTDKAEMRRAFSSHGVCSLQFIEIENAIQAINAMRAFGFPTIFKPTLSSGGRGICRVATDASNEEIIAAFSEASSYSSNGHVIIERFVQGPEYSVEMITSRGQTSVVAITEKTTTGAPYYVEIAHRQPAVLSDSERNDITEVAIGAVKACGIDNAPGHAEIRLTDEGAVIMEVAARLGGGFISSHLTPTSTGVDLLRATIDVSLGREPDLKIQRTDGAAIAFILPKPGRIVSITGVSEAQNDPFCIEANVYKKTGDKIEPLRNATGRAGHVIAQGTNGDHAEENAARIAGMIKIETEFGFLQGGNDEIF